MPAWRRSLAPDGASAWRFRSCSTPASARVGPVVRFMTTGIALPLPGKIGAMHQQLLKRGSVLVASLGALAASSGAAIASLPHYCDPLTGCKSPPSHYVKLSPSSVAPGKSTTVKGSVGHSCKTQVTLFSNAFAGETTHRFGRTPAVSVSASKKGQFSKRMTIKKTVKAGSYRVTGRCGASNFGSATLRVT
jgi:hypothetical protein